MVARRARALIAVLRGPLLLSPLADSLAGWTLARWAAQKQWSLHMPDLAIAGLAGCTLLAAGMAQNALADQQDDRLRKPDRPLPRGDLSPAFVSACFCMLTLTALALAALRPALWPGVLVIIVLTAAYHYGLKAQRLLGCLALGTLRATSMGLGVMAASGHWPEGAAAVGCAAYGLYITGASLHASTDDESGPGPSSTLGLGLAQLVLAGLAGWLMTLQLEGPDWAGPLVLLWAMARLHMASRSLPAPAVTGTALSGLHLLHGGLAAGLGQPLVASGILALFAVSRWLMRYFPPS